MDILEKLEAENERLKVHNQKLSEKFRKAIDSITEIDKKNAALRQENADLWKYIKLSKELAEEVRQENIRYHGKNKFCLCGCGRRLVQPATGRKKKFASDACRKRHERRQGKADKNEKFLRSMRRSPETSEKSETP